MLCSICNIPVVLPSDKNKKSNYYAIFKDNNIICSACDDVHSLLAPSVIENDKNEIEVKKEVKVSGILCMKCRNVMSGMRCVCGFVNPLFRK